MEWSVRTRLLFLSHFPGAKSVKSIYLRGVKTNYSLAKKEKHLFSIKIGAAWRNAVSFLPNGCALGKKSEVCVADYQSKI